MPKVFTGYPSMVLKGIVNIEFRGRYLILRAGRLLLIAGENYSLLIFCDN